MNANKTPYGRQKPRLLRPEDGYLQLVTNNDFVFLSNHRVSLLVPFDTDGCV